MRISVSRAPASAPIFHHVFFDSVEVGSAKMLGEIITKELWSPIVWSDGRRKGDNFLHCDALVLDFDDGVWTIERTLGWLKNYGYKFVIGTTKSHQIEKNGKAPCDRFRLIVPWVNRITCALTYVQNCERIIRQIPADKACKDAARIFQPCREIVAIGDGRGMTWRDYIRPPKRETNLYEQAGMLPRWVTDVLSSGLPDGQRNKRAFDVARKMAECGYSATDIESAILRASNGLDDAEVLRTVRSGVSYAGR